MVPRSMPKNQLQQTMTAAAILTLSQVSLNGGQGNIFKCITRTD